MFVGSELGVVEGKYQPMKIAAAEALWTTCPSPLLLLALPDRRGQQRPDPDPDHRDPRPAVHPGHQPRGRRGRRASTTSRPSTQKQYGPGNYVPNVFIQYWGMRVMAYLAALVLLFALWGAWLPPARRRSRRPRWFLCVAPWVVIAPVPHEHRRLAADRERPTTLDRPGPHEDRPGRLAVGDHHRHLDQLTVFVILYVALGVADAYLMIHYGRQSSNPRPEATADGEAA